MTSDPWRQRQHDAYRSRRRERAFLALAEPSRQREPCRYGLTIDELRAEAARLHALGFADWEIRAVLVDPRTVDDSCAA
jgi:hypothetical protein